MQTVRVYEYELCIYDKISKLSSGGGGETKNQKIDFQNRKVENIQKQVVTQLRHSPDRNFRAEVAFYLYYIFGKPENLVQLLISV